MKTGLSGQARRARRYVRARFLGRPGLVAQPRQWIFLVGCYNSGTTLLSSLLSRHSSIASMPTEGQFYTDQLPVPQYMGLARAWATQAARFRMFEDSGSEVDVDRLKRQWVRAARLQGEPALLEKSPTNAARIRWLNQNFENSYFIATTRDAYANIEGMVRRAGLDWPDAARQWSVSNEIMLEDLAQVPRTHLLSYEALTEEPAASLAAIFRFLDLDAENVTHEREQLKVHGEISEIRNFNSESICRLDPEVVDLINSIVGGVQQQLGYSVMERPHA